MVPILNEFKLTLKKSASHRVYFPVVLHKPCNQPVISGQRNMDQIMTAMETHVCVYKDKDASTS